MQKAGAAAQNTTPPDYAEDRNEVGLTSPARRQGLPMSSVTDLPRQNITSFIYAHIKVTNKS